MQIVKYDNTAREQYHSSNWNSIPAAKNGSIGRAKVMLVSHSVIQGTSRPLTDRRRELLSKERHCDRYQQIKTDPVLGGMEV